MFVIPGDWSSPTLSPGACYHTVCEGGCRFVAAWVREEEKASKNRGRMRETREVDKLEVAPGVIVGSLRRFKVLVLIEVTTQRLPKRRRLLRWEDWEPWEYSVLLYRCFAFG